jgi:tripartite tricarboxylate transporter family receptor
LIYHAENGAHTVREFVAYAKANPGKVNYGSPGFGTSSHLFGELIRQRTGIEIVHVPYRGATPAIADLLAGQVQMFIDNLRNVQSFIQAGRLRALVVTSEKRYPEMLDLPTMAEAGVPGVVGFYWNGVLAPAGTPQPIIDRPNTVINDGLRTRERAGHHHATRDGAAARPAAGFRQADCAGASILGRGRARCEFLNACAAQFAVVAQRNLLSSPRRRGPIRRVQSMWHGL